MSSDRQTGLASRFLVEDLPGAGVAGARLNGILLKIDAGEELSTLSRQFLTSSGLIALAGLVSGELSPDEFRAQAAKERIQRVHLATLEAQKKAAEAEREACARLAAVAANFAAMANDPVRRRRQEAKELRRRFGIGFVENEDYPRVMRLLRQIAAGRRPLSEEVVWLRTEADYCWTGEVEEAWHALEAAFLTKAWECRGDVWSAVNASAHWRKAGKPEHALRLTQSALAVRGLSTKARSALATSRGGALRDLRQFQDAKFQAEHAHALTPNDFRPCTLLGAVYIELGDLAEGHRWYEKAAVRGAKRELIDQELQALMSRCSARDRERIRNFLLAQDPERFGWVRTVA